MLRVFRRRAGWFVAVSWLLAGLATPIGFLIAAGAAINAFYFPAHRMAPFNEFDNKAATFVMVTSVIAALASSIALALKFRTTASVLVVAIWSVILFGTPAARLFVQPGPEYFERHLGQQVFLVPWRYGPAGFGSARQDPHEIGFSAHLCISNLKGAYDNDCRGGKQLYIVSRDWALSDFDVDFWRRRGSQMSPGPGREGYKSYAYEHTFPAGSQTRVVNYYFVRQDSEGRITRLVVCRFSNEDSCSHHALLANFGLRYDAPLTEGDNLDGRLASLVESWRMK
jgi:hypothetical protein